MLSSAASLTRASSPPRRVGLAEADTSALEITVRSRPSALAACSAWSAARRSVSAERPWLGNVATPKLMVSPPGAPAAVSARTRSAMM